jgi:hypothetical protein
MKIIIYATHSYGAYPTLASHPDIVVLGFGTKWKGFIEKARVINKFLMTLPDDEIVVILDGFDSFIKNTYGVEEKFKKMDCKVLYSVNGPSGFSKYIPGQLNNYITNTVFSKCIDNFIANTGLGMGYIEYFKIVYTNLLNGKSDDDQRNINEMCSQMPFIKLDTQHIIFENCETMDCVNSSSAHFCQLPGELSFSRIKRAVVEYTPFFIFEIVIFIFFIVFYIKC